MNYPANADDRPVTSSTLSFVRRTALLILIGAFCVGFFIADVATPSFFSEPFPAMLALGVVTAQLTVICVWGTLVRGTFWIRLPWTLLLLVLSWCGFACGITLVTLRADIDSMFGLAMVWMLGFVTSYVPLKIAATCFRWQIVRDTADDQNARQNLRYSIRDIMIGTFLLALSLAIGRAMLPDDGIDFRLALAASGLADAGTLFLLTVFGVVSLLVKLPCIWISLGEKAEKIKSRIGLWVVYCLALAIVEIGVLIAVFGSPGSDSGALFDGMIIGHQIMGAIILSVGFTLRGLGYRLERSVTRQAEYERAEQSKAAKLVSELDAL